MTADLVTEEITFSSGDKKMDGYLARPSGAGKAPAVIVIHEGWGLNDDIRRVVDDLAAQGYVAFAPDLFAGGGNRAFCMARLISGLFVNTLDHQGVRDLKACLDHLQGRADVDAARVGVIGFCMGGGYAIAWGCTDDRLKAIAPYYGTNPRPLEAVKRLCPVVGSYPGLDFTARDGRKLDAVLDGWGVEHEIKVYPGTFHSFYRHGRAHNAAAAEDSMSRVLAFFADHLGPAAS
jgi:carboxymethylenebutenolidase